MPVGALLVFAATTLLQDCSINGVVVDAGTEAPVGRAQVTLEGREDIGAATDAEGQFRIATEGCGKIQLIVTKGGFLAQRLSQDDSQNLRIKLQRESGVSGIVLDPDGQPIADTVVDVGVNLAGSFMHVPRQAVPVTATGEYAIRLPPAPYVICAHSGTTVYPIGGGHKLRYSDRCLNASVIAGQQQRLDFTLTALPAVHVSGSIRGTPEGSVPAVSIYRQGWTAEPAMAVKSAPGGVFDFSDVVPDVYTIEAAAISGDKPFFVSEDVTVGSGGITNLTLTMLPSISLTGSVRFQSSSGPKKAQLRVDLNPASGSVEWNETGDQFTISSVLQRKYRLGVIPLASDGAGVSPDFYVQSVRLNNQDVLGREFSVVGGAGPIDIVLADDFGTISGTVTDAEGKPAMSPVWVSGQNYQMRVMSDQDGRIKPLRVPPGRYAVSASDAATNPSDDETKIEVPPSGTVNVSLQRIPQTR
jgi:hypothetical protein